MHQLRVLRFGSYWQQADMLLWQGENLINHKKGFSTRTEGEWDEVLKYKISFNSRPEANEALGKVTRSRLIPRRSPPDVPLFA